MHAILSTNGMNYVEMGIVAENQRYLVLNDSMLGFSYRCFSKFVPKINFSSRLLILRNIYESLTKHETRN